MFVNNLNEQYWPSKRKEEVSSVELWESTRLIFTLCVARSRVVFFFKNKESTSTGPHQEH